MKRALVCLGLLLTAGPAIASDIPRMDSGIDKLSHAWAHINFELKDKAAQGVEAEQLARQAKRLAQQYPSRAEPLVWEAIITATEAGAKGGMGALGLAKDAKALLEQAEKINPNALDDGSVYTSLGSLYAQVPGFPIGFGDPKKARHYLELAVAAHPDSIDANYFYGDFLVRQGDNAGAVRALKHALNAPARAGREVEDHGRRSDARTLLAKAQAKLDGK